MSIRVGLRSMSRTIISAAAVLPPTPAAPGYFEVQGEIWIKEQAGYFNRT